MAGMTTAPDKLVDPAEEPHEHDGTLHYFNSSLEELCPFLRLMRFRRDSSIGVYDHYGVGWVWTLREQLDVSVFSSSGDDYELVWPETGMIMSFV